MFSKSTNSQISHHRSSIDRKMKQRIFISTGEVSGDWHGSILVQAMFAEAKQRGIELEIVALGGDRMAAAGVKLLGNTAAIGSIGLTEALPFVLPTMRLQRQAKQQLKQDPPDLAVLIDYVTPNLAMGSFFQNILNKPVTYYIAPQEWVWSFKDKNTKMIAGFTDKIFSIFPQEATYYRKHGANVDWVGHPLIDEMAKVSDRAICRTELGLGESDLIVTMLPASRAQEIKFLFPPMLEACQAIKAKLPQVKFLLALSTEKFRQPIADMLNQYGIEAEIVYGKSHQLIRAADLVLTKSGTVNLETALLGVPQVVIYKVSASTVWVARKILGFSIPFMSPPNLILEREVVPELFQEAATATNIAEACLTLLQDQTVRSQTLTDYTEMRHKLGKPGAATRAAQGILDLLTQSLATHHSL
ncbi:lipid-A-disaccharide synthase [Thalassoporum mexicanum PCC 7367]|uniref:lipid-A-disaccharide synthase n=1 Tax=Thalassoporum mexicanum TaxID=3457544 RepID=UPI00029F9C77|nr:lipid-A-disaccharide synthase [Pseudanabaena sp. PCC 7367]AFY68350.1 lipid-A-disaccharide synthase [Pseudanabaena sp. PCC 7367]